MYSPVGVAGSSGEMGVKDLPSVARSTQRASSSSAGDSMDQVRRMVWLGRRWTSKRISSRASTSMYQTVTSTWSI